VPPRVITQPEDLRDDKSDPIPVCRTITNLSAVASLPDNLEKWAGTEQLHLILTSPEVQSR